MLYSNEFTEICIGRRIIIYLFAGSTGFEGFLPKDTLVETGGAKVPKIAVGPKTHQVNYLFSILSASEQLLANAF